MKKIAEFLSSYFVDRLEAARTLVVYDPARRYRGVVLGLAQAGRTVVDASESTIAAREEAVEAWAELGRHANRNGQLVVYLPIAKPGTDEQRRTDPFQIFALGGAEFPRGDGETWRSLCQRAAPDKVEAINRVFDQGEPDFAVIDQILGEDAAFPTLQTLLEAQSTVEILCGLLAPDPAREARLAARCAEWLPELRQLVQTALQAQFPAGLGDLGSAQTELARLVLFSEFVFDLPATVPLPDALSSMPRAGTLARELVFAVCQRLRTTETTWDRYMELAERVARETQVEQYFSEVVDLGVRDTFAFEERNYLHAYAARIRAGDYAAASTICHDREQSIWVRHTDRQQLWSVATRLQALLQLTDDLEPRIPHLKAEVGPLVDLYCRDLRQLDTRHRELEQTVADAFGNLGELEPVVELGRKRYLDLAEALQGRFLAAVTRQGWPADGQLAHTEIFRRFVAPSLEARQKVAFFMVDALRFELAVALEPSLSQHFSVKVTPACAQLPTVTAVGMAALLPDAANEFRVTVKDEAVIPTLKGTPIRTPDDRMRHLATTYGDLCHRRDLDELLKPRIKIPDTTRLLVVTSGEIDQLCENTPSEAWRVLPGLMQKVLAGVQRVVEKGFTRIVIAADHGFFLTEAHQVGDVAPKPPGDWLIAKDRCLLGSGSSANGSIVFSAADVGVRGDFANYAVPASLATYAKGVGYFHSGLSLPECVIPVIEIDKARTAPRHDARVSLRLTYRGQTDAKVTTARPMIEVAVAPSTTLDEIADPQRVTFQLSAWSGKVQVGEVGACNHLDPSTGLIGLLPGEAVKIPFRLNDEFSGALEIRATDPVTNITHARLTLKTDYAE